MSVNSSSSSNHSLPLHQNSITSLLSPDAVICFEYSSTYLIFASFSVTNIIFLFPLYILIFSLGFKRRWKSASGAPATSHADIFTYHMVAIEMVGILGCVFFCCGFFAGVPWLVMLGVYFLYVISNGQMCLHILTCVEHHLAVVHPIAYQRVRNRGEVKIRNVTIALVWLFFLGSFGLVILASNFSILSFVFLAVAIVLVSFCSFSVLRVLVRPGPGDRERQRVDRAKLRAFHTITAIMGTLLLRFGGQLFVILMYKASDLSDPLRCRMLISGVWFSVPSSLVLPLLFLHRAGKLPCCNNNTNGHKDQSETS